jgi:hypothetical protein
VGWLKTALGVGAGAALGVGGSAQAGVDRRFDPPSHQGYEVVAAPATQPAALSARPAGGTEIGRYATGRFWVIRRLNGFLGISTLERHDNRLAWIRADAPGLRFSHTWLMAHVDLSQRRVWVTRDGATIFAARATVGNARTPTPVGVTSVFGFYRTGGYYPARMYGPAIAGLGLWQPRHIAWAPNGGVIAFHGMGSPAGGAVSAGCVRLPNAQMKRLRALLRVGTPVVIRA